MEIVGEIRMFFEYVKSAWKRGELKVGLSADKADEKVYFEANGLVSLATKFLSNRERQSLANLAKTDATSAQAK